MPDEDNYFGGSLVSVFRRWRRQVQPRIGEWPPDMGPGGGGYLTEFNTGRLRPEVQSLTLLYTTLTEKVPFFKPFIEKRYPFHIPTLQQCTSFLSPWNEVNESYYGKKHQALPEEMLSKRHGLFILFSLWNNRFPFPFIYLNLRNSYPFIYPKPEKGTPFGRSLPV